MFREIDKWEGSYDDPTDAESKEKAVFIGEQATGQTIAIGRENKEEWIRTSDLRPLELEEYR